MMKKNKRKICLIFSFFFIFSFLVNVTAVSVLAEEASETQAEEKKTEEEGIKKRKSGEPPIIEGEETAILIEALTGRILFEKDSRKKMFPASTTKIMTALLALEAVNRGELSLNSEIEVTEEMLKGITYEDTKMDLKVGEILNLDALLKGLLIPSGNDAAMAIAVMVAGSVEDFVTIMNERAAQLGCENTNFVNPNGLHNENHYTTAADMAKIAREAMKIFEFRDIVDCAHIKIPPTNLTEKERYYINTNGLMSSMRYKGYYYKDAIGIKTGYTSQAKNCLVSAAKKDGMEVIGVLLGGNGIPRSHNASIEMFDWAFDTYSPISCLDKGDIPCEIKVKQAKRNNVLTLATDSSVTVMVPNGTNKEQLVFRPNIPEFLTAPINAGEKIGTISVLLNNEEIGYCNLVATTNIERSFFWPVMMVGDFLWTNKITRTIIILLLCLLIFLIILFIYTIFKNIRIEKRRRERIKRKRANKK